MWLAQMSHRSAQDQSAQSLFASLRVSLGVNCSCTAAELGATADQLVNDQINVDALLDAVCSGRIDQVQALLSASPGVASVKQCDTGKLPLHTAAVAGNISIMAALVRAGASPEQQDGKERTALEVRATLEFISSRRADFLQGGHYVL